uniref:Uncharacterized protein n=1 Tax=Zea mays TaxID=4577 RepID=C4J7L8_MAIZE|nr:unknown [Zea mays]
MVKTAFMRVCVRPPYGTILATAVPIYSSSYNSEHVLERAALAASSPSQVAVLGSWPGIGTS